MNIVHSQSGDWNTISWCTSRAAILIILLNINANSGDADESDVLESDAGDRAFGIADGLNSNTIGRFLNSRREESHVLDIVGSGAAASTDGTDGETMATRAVSTGESNVLLLIRKVVDAGKRDKLTVPELTATQSSWFLTIAPEMKMF